MTDKPTITSYVCSAIAAGVGGWTDERIAIWVGISTAIGTFFVNWYYKRRQDQREEAKIQAEADEHELIVLPSTRHRDP